MKPRSLNLGDEIVFDNESFVITSAQVSKDMGGISLTFMAHSPILAMRSLEQRAATDTRNRMLTEYMDKLSKMLPGLQKFWDDESKP